jgi:hypothetical protein
MRVRAFLFANDYTEAASTDRTQRGTERNKALTCSADHGRPIESDIHPNLPPVFNEFCYVLRRQLTSIAIGRQHSRNNITVIETHNSIPRGRHAEL